MTKCAPHVHRPQREALEPRNRLEEFRGMLTAPTTLAFSPSGQRLGCAGNGNPTRIWEPPSLNDQPAAMK